MIKALIVEDEAPNARLLKNLVTSYCPQINLLGISASVKAALIDIPAMQPELIFMDVMLSDGTSFDILSKISERNFEVIFTTAHDEFAIKAIKFSALDYIVKPVEIEELKVAVAKVEEKLQSELKINPYDLLLQNLKSSNGRLQRIALPSMEGHLFVEVKDIVRLEADGSYTKVFLLSKEKVLVSKPIKEYESMLLTEDFFRIHNSHLVNLLHVKKYVKGSGGHVVMSDGSEVEVAFRRKEDFLKAIHIH